MSEMGWVKQTSDKSKQESAVLIGTGCPYFQ